MQEADFDLSTEVAALRADNPKVGAVACFVGTVRDLNEGQTVQAMELEHYPGMTEKALEAIAAQARERWPGSDVLIVHRVEKLLPLDQIVLVVTTAMHRAQAFESCAFVMDYLKTQAPFSFWKRKRPNTAKNGSTLVNPTTHSRGGTWSHRNGQASRSGGAQFKPGRRRQGTFDYASLDWLLDSSRGSVASAPDNLTGNGWPWLRSGNSVADSFSLLPVRRHLSDAIKARCASGIA
ncbi:MAG: Molybdopterin synthase catalytic subunit MoaE (EC [uncultured Caballeronia sp.]|nr:MAG: Molybdopterin synthase catalytic subunit MoaE (EC [uncultured Caballeronia sp.]